MVPFTLAPATLLLLSFVPLALGNEAAKTYAHLLLFAFVMVGALACYRRKDLFLFVTPNALVFFYTTISMALGAWGFSTGHVIGASSIADYGAWKYTHIALTLIMLCLSILLSVDYYHHDRYIRMMSREGVRVTRTQMLAASTLVLFFFVPLDLGFFGAQGNLAILPKSVFAIISILYVSKFTSVARWLFYLALIAVFATFSIHEKREAIFLIFPIVYVELLRSRRQLNLKTVWLSTVVAAFLLTLILTMSISRGYGEFGDFENILDALPFLVAYLNSDLFITSLLYNVEGNYFFFHAINSIQLVLNDLDLVSWGSTIIKPLFILVPRFLLTWKPESIISLYTTTYDPAFRALGGSWPISLLSEFIWNFAYLAPLAAMVLALLFVRMQRSLLKAHAASRVLLLGFLLYAYMHVVTLARGSGIDQYVLYLLIGGACFAICTIIEALLTQAAKGMREHLWLRS